MLCFLSYLMKSVFYYKFIPNYQTINYTQSQPGFVDSAEVELGMRCEGRKETSQHVPILDLLKKFLSIKDIQEPILTQASKQLRSEILEDYSDGPFHTSKSAILGIKGILQIHLYTNEFEVINPTGAKRGKHKLCTFHWQLGTQWRKICAIFKEQIFPFHALPIGSAAYAEDSKPVCPLLIQNAQIFGEGHLMCRIQ